MVEARYGFSKRLGILSRRNIFFDKALYGAYVLSHHLHLSLDHFIPNCGYMYHSSGSLYMSKADMNLPLLGSVA